MKKIMCSKDKILQSVEVSTDSRESDYLGERRKVEALGIYPLSYFIMPKYFKLKALLVFCLSQSEEA